MRPTAAVHRSPSPELLITVVFSIAGLLAYLAAASAGWPGAPSPCLGVVSCYCEETIAGVARQPANTWSNLAVLVVAAFVASDAARLRRGETPWFTDGPADSPGRLPGLGLLYALVIAFELPAPTRVWRAVDLEGRQREPDDIENVGTRHRAAYRFAQEHPRGLAVVISHDGGVSFVAHREREVVFWEQSVGL